jgi:hypothetical protein
VHVAHAVDDVWEAADRARPLPSPRAEPRTLLVWRRQLVVRHRALDADEAMALRRVSGVAAFADVCAELARDRSDVAAAERACALLRQWIADEILAG